MPHGTEPRLSTSKAVTMHAMNAYRAIHIYLPSFPTSALDGRRGKCHGEVAAHSREDPPEPTARMVGGSHGCARYLGDQSLAPANTNHDSSVFLPVA